MNMTQQIDPELVRYIEREILPRYTRFDRAHGVDHARTVIDASLRLAARCGADAAMAYVVAAYHDVGLEAGRERHHIVSGERLRADATLRRWFSEAQIDCMACAAEDHRASAGQAPRSLYGRIVAEADRVIDAGVTLRRTVQYGLEHYPELPREAQYARFCAHLRGKYGEGGYLRLWLAESDNAERLARLRELLADEARLRAAFDALYAAEGGV